MFNLKRIIFFLFFFNLCFLAQADDKIAFFDLDEVLNKSISGKNIFLKIEKKKKKNPTFSPIFTTVQRPRPQGAR